MAEHGGRWVDALGHVANEIVFGGIVGPWIGAKLHASTMTRDQRQEILREAATKAKEVIERELRVEREDVMKTLLALKHQDYAEVDAILELLTILNQPPRFLHVFGRHYTEHLVIKMLQAVDVDERGWIYPVLNATLRDEGREKFFALLETYHDDGWVQFGIVARDIILKLPKQVDDAIGRQIARMMGVVTVAEARTRLQSQYDRLAPPVRRTPSKSPLWEALRRALPW